jgi:hypothetical protein
MTEREKQVWIAVFGAQYQVCHGVRRAAVLARNAVIAFRAMREDGENILPSALDMAREVMYDRHCGLCGLRFAGDTCPDCNDLTTTPEP